MQAFDIQPALATDAPDCVRLRGQTRENAVSEQRLREVGVTAESWARDIETGALPGFVCRVDGGLAGYCFGEIATGEVVVLALLPAFEGCGLGRALLDKVVATLRTQGHAKLFLGCSSDPAVRSYGFYRHLGWRSTGAVDRLGDEVLELIFPTISLREITADTVRAVIKLSVADSQKGFVAPNSTSLSQALFSPEAWYRAIYRADDVVGFVMLEDESLRPSPPIKPAIGVWRLMIDERFQGQGFGRAALLLVIEHAKSRALFDTLELSYVPGPGCPEPFYLGLGFRHTGRVSGGEVVLEFPLHTPI